MLSSPAVSKDGATIFVGSLDCEVYAMDAVTGAKKWSFETGCQTGYQVRASPAVSKDGTTIFVVGDVIGDLPAWRSCLALDAVTGAKK